MKALILVGGYGTRLRPLTFSYPKPLVPFVNMPIVTHQIEALVKVGVKHIILAVNYQPQQMMEYLAECEKKYNVRITCSLEEQPLGTAGPLALAREILKEDGNQYFFMFNSDVICTFPLQQMLDFHTNHGGEGTIMVTEVKDPSKYGVVVADENGQIERFVEKPQTFVSNKINAGIYLFSTKILDRIQLKPTSIEREIFPHMAADKTLYSMVLPGYWMDIGQPKDYLVGLNLHLQYLGQSHSEQLSKIEGVTGNVIIHPTAKIGKNCSIGPSVSIGANCVVEDGACIRHSALFDNVVVKQSAVVKDSIIGWSSVIGKWSRVTSSTLGEDIQVANEVSVHEIIVCPHKGVSETCSNKLIM